MNMLFERTSWIRPALSPMRDWYGKAFSLLGKPIKPENFFEPDEVIRDLEHIVAEAMRRNAHLPVFYWLRTGNEAGIIECASMGSVDIYDEGTPCWVTSDWNGVSIWGRKGKIRELTGIDRFDCILRKRSIADCENNTGVPENGTQGIVYIQKQSFFDRMRPHLFDLFTPCEWAMQRRLQVFPRWS